MTETTKTYILTLLAGMDSYTPWTNAAAGPYLIAFDKIDDDTVRRIVEQSAVTDAKRQAAAVYMERIARESAAIPTEDAALSEVRRNIRYFPSGDRQERIFSHGLIADCVEQCGGMARIRRMESGDVDTLWRAEWKKVSAERIADVQKALMLPAERRPAHLFGPLNPSPMIPAQARALASYSGPEITEEDKRGAGVPALRRMMRIAAAGGQHNDIIAAGKRR